MSTFEANPHLCYGCAYTRLFAGQWHIEDSLDIPGDAYGLVVSFVNMVALAMEPPFPHSKTSSYTNRYSEHFC
jgi:hypothetical protein